MDFQGKYFLYKKEGKDLSFRNTDQLDAYRSEWEHTHGQVVRKLTRTHSNPNPPPDISPDDEVSFRRNNEVAEFGNMSFLSETVAGSPQNQPPPDESATPGLQDESITHTDQGESVRPRVTFDTTNVEDISRSDDRTSLPRLDELSQTEIVDLASVGTSVGTRTPSTFGTFDQMVETLTSGVSNPIEEIAQNNLNEDRSLRRSHDELTDQYNLSQMENAVLQRRIDSLMRETALLKSQLENNPAAQASATRGLSNQTANHAHVDTTATPLEPAQRVPTPRNQGTAPQISNSGSSDEDHVQQRASREARRKLKTRRPQSSSPPKKPRARYTPLARDPHSTMYSHYQPPQQVHQNVFNENLPSTTSAPQTYFPPPIGRVQQNTYNENLPSTSSAPQTYFPSPIGSNWVPPCSYNSHARARHSQLFPIPPPHN